MPQQPPGSAWTCNNVSFNSINSKMAENSSWPTRTRGFGKYLNIGHPYCYWCPSVTGYQYPKCWLRVCNTKTVSYMMRYGFFKVNFMRIWNQFLWKMACLLKGQKTTIDFIHMHIISKRYQYFIWYAILSSNTQNWFLIIWYLPKLKQTGNKTVQATDWIWIICTTKIGTFF